MQLGDTHALAPTWIRRAAGGRRTRALRMRQVWCGIAGAVQGEGQSRGAGTGGRHGGWLRGQQVGCRRMLLEVRMKRVVGRGIRRIASTRCFLDER